MKNAKKSLAVTLAALFAAASFAGCSGSSQSASSAAASSAASSEAASSEAASSEAASKPAETVTVTVKTYHATGTMPTDFSSTAVGKAILEKLNIKVVTESQSASDAVQDLTTDLASGELPDISMTWENGATWQNCSKAAAQGVFADLSGSIKNYGPIISEWLADKDIALKTQQDLAAVNTDGKVYFIPTSLSDGGTDGNAWGLYIRQDIATKLGIKTDGTAVNTPEAFKKMLESIKAGGFKDTTGKDVYPAGFCADWAARPVFNPFVYGNIYDDLTINNGKVECWELSSLSKDCVKYFYSLFSGGLIDPESFTQTYDAGMEKFATGRYAITGFYSYWAFADGNKGLTSLYQTNPEMKYVVLGRLNNCYGNNEEDYNTGESTGLCLWVSKKANTDACVQLINYLSSKEGFTLANYGTSDMWQLDSDNAISFTDAMTAEKTKDSDAFNQKYGLVLTGYSVATPYDASNNDLYAKNDYKYNYKVKETDQYKARAANIKMMCQNLKIINKLDISKVINDYSAYDTLNPILSKRSSILAAAFAASSEDAALSTWDGYVSTLKSNGIDDYIKYAQSIYDKDPDKYSGFQE
jgi:putative aldouronate transport system substrate-binding protein